MPTNDLAELRKCYMQGGLLESDALRSPLDQFQQWLNQAGENSPGEWFEVNAMTLSTASTTGQVTSRVVLLKGLGEDGLRFFTNYSSEKGQQLAQNPQAALNFFWPHVERQVRILGEVSKLPREVALEYFHSRPRDSQLGALASDQSKVVASRDALQQRFDASQQQLAGQPVPMPENWGGYLLTPRLFEFWQGRAGRLHDRLRYTQQANAWTMQRLAP